MAGRPSSGRLDGLTILVVEDEFLVSLALEEDLRAAGAAVVGPFNDLISGLSAAASERFDVAVLDVNLAGTMIYPLADDLAARGVPFLFVSGYTASDMPSRFAATPRLGKPADGHRLVAAIQALIRKR